MVTCPRLLRPPDFLIGSSSDFSGVARVISSKPDTERKRVPAVMGRNCRMLMLALEDGEGLALLEGDDRLLPARRAAADPPTGHLVAAHLHGTHRRDVHAELQRERVADLVFVGLGMHLEGVLLPRLIRGGALLGDQGPDDRLAERGHQLSFFFFFGGCFTALRLAAGLAGAFRAAGFFSSAARALAPGAARLFFGRACRVS